MWSPLRTCHLCRAMPALSVRCAMNLCRWCMTACLHALCARDRFFAHAAANDLYYRQHALRFLQISLATVLNLRGYDNSPYTPPPPPAPAPPGPKPDPAQPAAAPTSADAGAPAAAAAAAAASGDTVQPAAPAGVKPEGGEARVAKAGQPATAPTASTVGSEEGDGKAAGTGRDAPPHDTELTVEGLLEVLLGKGAVTPSVDAPPSSKVRVRVSV